MGVGKVLVPVLEKCEGSILEIKYKYVVTAKIILNN